MRTAESALAATKSDLNKTNTKLDTTKSELTATKSELTALKGTLNKTQSNLDVTNKKLNEARTELSTTKGELTKTKQKLHTAKTELDTTKTTLDGALAEIETLKTQLTEARSNKTSSSQNDGKNNTSGGAAGGKNTPTTRTEKDYYGVALAIWNGKYGWGTGTTREKNLKAKGFDVAKMKQIINQLGKDGHVHNGSWVGKYHGIKNLSAYHINKFAQGTLSADEDQLALIDELGEELQLVPGSSGRLEYIKKGTGIVPADLTERLMNMAMNPQEMIDSNRPVVAPSNSVINTELSVDCSVGSLVHIEHCDQNTLPAVEKIVNKAFEQHMRDLNNNLKKYTR